MRKKKWLFILVASLLFINIIYHLVTNYTDLDIFLIKQATENLESLLNAKIEIESFTITDRQAHLSNVVVTDLNERYHVIVKNLYIEYNLFKILFSNIKLYHTIDNIIIYEPEITINLDRSESTPSLVDSGKPIDLFEAISGKFKGINVYHGSVMFNYSDDLLSVSHFFDYFQMTIESAEEISSTFTIGNRMVNKKNLTNRRAVQTESDFYFTEDPDILGSKISGNLSITEDDLSIRGKITDFTPDIESEYLKDPVFEIEGHFTWEKSYGSFSFDGEVKNFTTQAVIDGTWTQEINAPSLNIQTYKDNLFISSAKLSIGTNIVDLDASLTSIMTDPHLSLSANTTGVPINQFKNYLPESAAPQGKIDLSFDLSWRTEELELTGKLLSENIKLFDEEFDNLHLYIRSDKSNDKSYPTKIVFELFTGYWRNNPLNFMAELKNYKDFNFESSLDNAVLILGDSSLSFDMFFSGALGKELLLELELSNLGYFNEHIILQDFSASAQIVDSSFIASLRNDANSIIINKTGNLHEHRYNIEFDFKNLPLTGLLQPHILTDPTFKYFFSPLHTLHGHTEINIFENLLSTNAEISLRDPIQNKLHATFLADGSIDLESLNSNFNIFTKNSRFNDHPFDLDFQIAGSKDGFFSEKFTINQDIIGNFELCLKNDFLFSMNLLGSNLSVSKYLRYFTDTDVPKKIAGRTNFLFNYNSSNNQPVSGYLVADGLTHQLVQPLDLDLSFSGDLANIFANALLRESGKDTSRTINTSAFINFLNGFSINMITETGKLDIESLTNNDVLKSGFLELNAGLYYENKQFSMIIDKRSNDLQFNNHNIKQFHLLLTQDHSGFYLDDLTITGDNDFYLTASGAIGYNILTEEFLPLDETITLNLQGDLLSILSEYVGFIEQAASETDIEITLGIMDNELSIRQGFIDISRARIKLINQPETLQDLSLRIEVVDNITNFKEAVLSMGDGKLSFRNEITGNETDFKLGMIEIGHIYARSSGKGLNINIPGYLSRQTMAVVRVRGRDSREAQIMGPFDDIRVTADLFVSNANLIFPKETDNWLKLIQVGQDSKTSSIYTLPVTFDINFIAESQVRYVTYPIYLIIQPESYFHFVYDNGSFIIEDSFITSESGNINIFNNTFLLDFAQLIINDRNDELRLNGMFYKTAFDGSLVTLEISNYDQDKKIQNFNDLQFILESDNPQDRTILHILAKLRYNRNFEDLTQSQQQSLIQDEFLIFAGLGIEKYFTDPLFFTLERKIRQYLRLDYFVVRPGFFGNLIDYYTLEDNRPVKEETQIVEFGKNILLNNLSINLGKNLRRDIYFDYEFNVQKSLDIVSDIDLLVYHNFTIEHRLPFRLILAYKYQLRPEKEKNSYEVFLKRNFRF